MATMKNGPELSRVSRHVLLTEEMIDYVCELAPDVDTDEITAEVRQRVGEIVTAAREQIAREIEAEAVGLDGGLVDGLHDAARIARYGPDA